MNSTSIASALPTDIAWLIFQHCDQQTLTQLALSSKLFNQIASVFIYTNVEILNWCLGATTRLLDTLDAHPEYYRMLKHPTITIGPVTDIQFSRFGSREDMTIALVEFLGKSPNVVSLRLVCHALRMRHSDYFNLSTCPPETQAGFRAFFASVISLDLDGTSGGCTAFFNPEYAIQFSRMKHFKTAWIPAGFQHSRLFPTEGMRDFLLPVSPGHYGDLSFPLVSDILDHFSSIRTLQIQLKHLLWYFYPGIYAPKQYLSGPMACVPPHDDSILERPNIRVKDLRIIVSLHANGIDKLASIIASLQASKVTIIFFHVLGFDDSTLGPLIQNSPQCLKNLSSEFISPRKRRIFGNLANAPDQSCNCGRS